MYREALATLVTICLAPSVLLAQATPEVAEFRQVQSHQLARGRVLQLGFKATGVAVVRVVESSGGRVRAEIDGTAWRWMAQPGYVLLRRGEHEFVFDPNTERLEGPLPIDEIVIRYLRDGTEVERNRVLRRIAADRELAGLANVREAVTTRLGVRLSEHGPGNRDGDRGAGQAQVREEELELLVSVVGSFRMPESVALIVKANTFSMEGALVPVGRPSVSKILRVLSIPASQDSGVYRVRLFRALQKLTGVFDDVAADPAVVRLVRATLRTPVDVPSLEVALEMADDLDDGESMGYVRLYAHDAEFRAKQIGDAAASERVRVAAARIISRRIVI